MSFKPFNLQDDFAAISSAVNEQVSVTGSIFGSASNVKAYKNIASGSDTDLGGYFQTVYDAAPSASLSSPLFDITYGQATGSSLNVIATLSSSKVEKNKIYRMFASLLLGNPDATFTIGGVSRKEAVFVLFKRNVMKDQLKKGTVSLTINSSAPTQYTASDLGAAAAFQQDLGGDYAALKYNGTGSEVGQVWYNAGVIVIHPDTAYGAIPLWSGSKSLLNVQASGTINQVVDGFRAKTERLDFNNQINLQSSVYFCRAYNNEFNYSSNPTFTDENGMVRVTSGSNVLTTQTYVTTIALYDENDNCLGTGKVNKPVVKNPQSEAIFRLRLDY